MSADPADALGGRLPLADRATLTGEQLALFDRMMARVVPWADAAGFQSTVGKTDKAPLRAAHGAPPPRTPDQEVTR